jgi:hypothetical protein
VTNPTEVDVILPDPTILNVGVAAGGSFTPQSANFVFSGPSSGPAAAPAFRVLVPADIPSLDAGKITSGLISQARLGTGSDGSGTHFLADDQTYKLIGGADFPAQAANKVFAGPTSGGNLAPAFRSLVVADIPSGIPFTGLDFTGSNLTSIATRNFSSLQSIPANLSALGALVGAVDNLPYFTGVGAMALTDFSPFSRNLLGSADATEARFTLAAIGGSELVDSIFVANSGTTAANGLYTKRGTSNTKPYYNLVGQSDDPSLSAISWDTSDIYPQWIISSSTGDALYSSVTTDEIKIQIPSGITVGQSFNVHSGGGFDYAVNFTNVTLASSSVTLDNSDDAIINIGISDAPTPTQIASKLSALTNTLTVYPYTATTLTDTYTLKATVFGYFYSALNINTAGVTLVSNTVFQDGSATPDLALGWNVLASSPAPSVYAVKPPDSGVGLVKPAVAVVATSNLTLSGEQTIDGILTSKSLVLCTAQSTGANNGPWVSNSGSWTRPTWYATGSIAQAPQFLTTFVRLGTTYSGSTWRMTTAHVTIGTTATTWVQTPVSLATSNVTGTLSVGNGGTGITSFGTGVATALGINVGSAGAFVTFNGALGTPSSGTLTNCTFPTLNQDTTGSALSLKSNATTGLMQIVGPAAASTRVKTIRDANDTLLELGGSYSPTGTWTFAQGSISTIQPFSISQTWTNGGNTYRGLLVDVTPTNYASGASLLRLQTNGVNIMFDVDPLGNVTVGGLTASQYVKTDANKVLVSSSAVPIGEVSGLGAGIVTFLGTPSSANLRGALTDENGTGAALFDSATNPTFTGATIDSGSLVIQGNQSAAAWTTSGIRIKGISGTLTDTTSSGTVAAAYTNKLGGNTIAASSSTTFTNYISSYFSEPVAGTNVTLTNKWGLGADSLYVGTSNPVKITSAGVLTATSPVLTTPDIGTPSAGTLTNCTFPTLNQNTTGSAASLSISGQTGLLTFTGLTSTNRVKTISNAADTIAELGQANTFTAANIISTAGAASTPALKLSGIPFAGTGTTSFPLLYINDSNATASTTMSTSGTSFGINAHTGIGNLMDLMLDGASKFSITSGGVTTIAGNTTINGASGLTVTNSGATLHQDGAMKIGGRAGLTALSTDVMDVTNTTAGRWAQLRFGSYGSTTNAVVANATIGTRSSGTPAAGLGSGILFNIDSTTTADQNAAQIAALWTTATHASRTAALQFSTVNNAGSLTEVARFDGPGDFLLGTTTAPTANNGKAMVFGDNTNKPTLGASTTALYQKSGEQYVQDANGNETLLSSHDKQTGEWIHYSTGKTRGLRIDMERMMKFLNNHFGTDFVHEFELEEA